MRQLQRLAFVCLLPVLSCQAQILLTPSDNSGDIRFQIKNFGLTVDGSLSGLHGKIVWDETSNKNSSFDMSINTSSISTGIALRDKHLRKEDYFDAVKFPLIQFKSARISPLVEPGVFEVEGNLTIKGITKPVSFSFRFSRSNDAYVFSGRFSIDRSNYGIGNNSLSLSENVLILLNVHAVKAQTNIKIDSDLHQN